MTPELEIPTAQPTDAAFSLRMQGFQKLMGALMKLGPVLQKIDFYSSQSSVSTYDGANMVRTEGVVTFKPPSSQDGKTARAK